MCLILSMTSCSEKSDYHFKNPADALEQYRDFHHSIAAVPQTKAEQLADFICQWQELSDTVYNYIKKDPAFTAHASLSMTFQETSDSVRTELFRLAVDCNLSDVAYVKMHTSPYRDNADLDATKKKRLRSIPLWTSSLSITKETCVRKSNSTAVSLLPPRSMASTTRRNFSLLSKRKTVISAPSFPISVITRMLAWTNTDHEVLKNREPPKQVVL